MDRRAHVESSQRVLVDVGDVSFDELEGGGREGRKVRPLDRGVVVLREGVDPDDLIPSCDQSSDEVAANEAGGAGDEDPNRSTPLI